MRITALRQHRDTSAGHIDRHDTGGAANLTARGEISQCYPL